MLKEIEVYLPRVGRLDTTGWILTEMGKVYRDARTRKIPSAEATKLAYILMGMARTLEGAELERRLDELERQLTNKGGNYIYELYENPIEESVAIPP